MKIVEILKYSIFNITNNKRQMIMISILISLSVYLSLVFIVVSDSAISTAQMQIAIKPKNVTVEIMPSKIEESVSVPAVISEQLIEELGDNNSIKSFQVHYGLDNITSIEYQDFAINQLGVINARVIDETYNVFNEAYIDYMKYINKMSGTVIMGDAFDMNKDCQALVSENFCYELEIEYEDIIGSFFVVKADVNRNGIVESKQIKVRIVGVYSNNITESAMIGIDLGNFNFNTKIKTEVAEGEELGFDWSDIIFNAKVKDELKDDHMIISNKKMDYSPTSLEVVLKDYDDISDFTSYIKEQYGYNVYSKISSIREQIHMIKGIGKILAVLIIFVTVIAMINIVNSIIIILRRRSKNIAILRAVGIKDFVITSILEFEIGIISIISYIVALIFANYTLLGMKTYIVNEMSDDSLAEYIQMEIGMKDCIAVLICTVLLAVISALVPILIEIRRNAVERIKS